MFLLPGVVALVAGQSDDPAWDRAADIVSKMTLDEKFGLIQGNGTAPGPFRRRGHSRVRLPFPSLEFGSGYASIAPDHCSPWPIHPPPRAAVSRPQRPRGPRQLRRCAARRPQVTSAACSFNLAFEPSRNLDWGRPDPHLIATSPSAVVFGLVAGLGSRIC